MMGQPSVVRLGGEVRWVLLGEYEQRLDEKNRVTIPARLRGHFGEGLIVTRGLDNCLVGHTRDGFETFVAAQTARLDWFSRETRLIQRYLYGGAVEAELDRQGRVALPATLIKHAKLERDVVVAGLRDRIEIWNRDAWQQAFEEAEGSVESVAERLAQEPHS
jgi:MraZ protein